MFNLEKEIQKWEHKLRSNPAFEDGDIAELESHLREEVSRLQGEGLTEDIAFKKAVEAIGQPETIGEELYRNRTGGRGTKPPWKQSSWMPSLLPNYLKVTFRNMGKDPVNSFINVFGLSMGLACVILIFLFVRFETSYDQHHEKTDRIYRLIYDEYFQGDIYHWAYSWSDWAEGLQEQYPEIEEAVRLRGNPSSFNETVHLKDEVFREARLFFADPKFFRVFDYEFLRGDPGTALTRPDAVVLTDKTAKKYFGDIDPIGQELLLNGEDRLEVTGVVGTSDETSHINFDLLLSFNFMYRDNPDYSSTWIYTYLLLNESANVANLEAELAKKVSWFTPHPDFGEIQPELQAVSDIHLYSNRRGELGTNGDILYVYVFSFVAVLILLITCLNYVNLSSAGAFRRFREIGMRKTLGALKKQLAGQFLGESVVIALMGLCIAILFAEPISRLFSSYLNVSLNAGLLYTPAFLGSITAITILTGLIAGLYPAIYLASLNPISTLKGREEGVQSRKLIRDGGVVVQFIISIVLLVGAFVIKSQVHHLQNRDTGFSREQVVTVPIADTPIAENMLLFKERLLSHTSITGVTASSIKPGVQDIWIGTFQPEGYSDGRNWIVPHLLVEHDFLETYDIELVEGRGFSREYASDTDEAFILNESAVQDLGWKEPIGKRLETWGDKRGLIIGVARDFNFETLRQPIQPLVLHISEDHFGHASIRIETDNAAQVLEYIEQEWNNMVPGLPFQYSFLDNEFRQVYQAEVRMGRLTSLFTGIALFFACLGLWGLTAFTVKSKRKEIGVRKVLGATVSDIILMLSRSFTGPVMLAILLAVPVSWYTMSVWLDGYTYRITIGWWIFAASGGIALIIAWLTVGWQSVRAARVNPVKSLRSE